jgi:hypothetical protein
MRDQRRATRAELKVPMTLAGSIRARCSDISPGGLCAELSATRIPGSRLKGTLELKGRQVPFLGELAWAEASASGEGCRVGLRFLEIDQALLPGKNGQ